MKIKYYIFTYMYAWKLPQLLTEITQFVYIFSHLWLQHRSSSQPFQPEFILQNTSLIRRRRRRRRRREEYARMCVFTGEKNQRKRRRKSGQEEREERGEGGFNVKDVESCCPLGLSLAFRLLYTQIYLIAS